MSYKEKSNLLLSRKSLEIFRKEIMFLYRVKTLNDEGKKLHFFSSRFSEWCKWKVYVSLQVIIKKGGDIFLIKKIKDF